MADRQQRITLAAAAIANARGGRRGAPQIANILDILPDKLKSEVTEDAEAALDAGGIALFDDTAEKLAEILDQVLDHVVVTCRPEASPRPHDVRVSEIIPAELGERAAHILLELGL